MKFDAVLMNPPYNRSLHLEILNEIVKSQSTAEIVNLSPIRWLQDPLAEYKKNSDFNKYDNIRQNITDIEEIPANDATGYFDAAITINLGIYYINNNIESSNIDLIDKTMKSILNKSINKFNGYTPIKVQDVKKPVFSLITTLDGGHAERKNSKGSSFDFIRNEKWYGKYYKDGISTNGFTLEENKARNKMSTNGKIDSWACVEFDTVDEAESFYLLTKTKFFKFIYASEMVGVNVHPQFLPSVKNIEFTTKDGKYLNGFKSIWSDNDLYEYANLTDEEISLIEKTMEKYK